MQVCVVLRATNLVHICDLVVVLVVSIWHHEVSIEQRSLANHLLGLY